MKENPEFGDHLSEQYEAKKKPLFTRSAVTREALVKGKTAAYGRELINRLERAELYHLFQILRKEIRTAAPEEKAEGIALRNELTKKSKEMQQLIDELNRQFHEQAFKVQIEMPEIGSFDIPVAELDLAPAEDPEKDQRVPYIFLGGLTTNYFQTAALSMALGMEDQKVFALTYPEQKISNPPKALTDAITKQKSFKLHAEILKQTVAKLGTGKVNLVGYSMGTGVMMEAMKDLAFAERVNDLVLLEPIGLVEKSLPKIAKEFLVDQAFGQTFPNVEDRVKGWLQGDTTGGAPVAAIKNDIDIIRSKQFDAESISRMAPSGSLQVWFSPNSPLMNAKEIDGAFEGAAKLRHERGDVEVPQTINHVKSATHAWPLVHAIGLAGRLTQPRPSSEKITELSQEDLDRTYAQKLLKEVTGKMEK